MSSKRNGIESDKGKQWYEKCLGVDFVCCDLYSAATSSSRKRAKRAVVMPRWKRNSLRSKPEMDEGRI